MGLNSPLPVRLQDETRKAAKIMRSFVDSNNNGLDKVIPRSVLERAAGFAIFTVIKAGFLFSARAGTGVVIARTQDGSWSPPSAIGLGGFGFGGQAGAEVTDFLVVLNSRAAVTTFMSSGSLTLGGNLSVAVGPLGRNAEGTGALSSKGKMAAMYSYSKTKGLFGGVSVEGSVIVERQDANRLAYGGSPTAKQILSGAFDPPDWANVLIDQLQHSASLPGGQVWRDQDEDGEGGGMGWASPTRDGASGSGGNRSRGGSVGQGYVFGEGIGSGGRNTPTSPGIGNDDKDKAGGGGRRRAGSLLGGLGDKSRPQNKRNGSLNPFGSGKDSPKRAGPVSSSESYNAGLTWDSDGPMQGYATRPRSNTNPIRPVRSNYIGKPSRDPSPDEKDELNDSYTATLSKHHNWDDDDVDGTVVSRPTKGDNLAKSMGRLSTQDATRHGRTPVNDVPDKYHDEDAFLPRETTSQFASQRFDAGFSSPVRKASPSKTNGNGYERFQESSSAPRRTGTPSDPFDDDNYASRRRGSGSNSQPFGQYQQSGTGSGSGPSATSRHAPPQAIPLKAGLDTDSNGFARAVALYDFTATDAGDLGFTAGQVITIMDKPGSGDWWKGHNVDGKVGIFPANYIEVLDIPQDLKGGVSRSDLKARMGGSPFD